MRVLVVDDDDNVRFLVSEGLVDAGYDVLRAASGREALLALALTLTSAPPIDVLVTDIRMPEMTGWEVARRVREIFPDLPVIYITGYVERMEAQVPGGMLLHKPFQIPTLLSAIQTLADLPDLNDRVLASNLR